MKVAVIGAGISGLTTAHALVRAGHDVTCLEAAPTAGGLIATERRDGFLCESGAQAVLDGAPEVRALIEDLGLARAQIAASPAARRRFVFVRGRLRALPSGPLSLLATDLLSVGAKWRLLREPFVPRRTDSDDESILAFATRRFGSEAARSIAAPAAIGIFAADAARLSLRSAFPRLAALETRHGSLLSGLRAARREGTTPGRLVSFPNGMKELVRALAARLGPRLRHRRVDALRRETAGWRLDLDGQEALQADRVVLTAGPRASAHLIEPLAPAAAAALRAIPLASVAAVCLGFRRSDIGVRLGAYGFLVARGERPTLLGCQYESSIFPGRAPAGAVLLRAIAGGTFDPGAVDLPDAALVDRTLSDLRVAAGLTAAPDFVAVFRQRDVIPQYEIGHEERVGAVDDAVARLPGLSVSGHALRGVGVSDCIRAASALAADLAP